MGTKTEQYIVQAKTALDGYQTAYRDEVFRDLVHRFNDYADEPDIPKRIGLTKRAFEHMLKHDMVPEVHSLRASYEVYPDPIRHIRIGVLASLLDMREVTFFRIQTHAERLGMELRGLPHKAIA